MPSRMPSTNPGKATSKLQNQLQAAAEESTRNELYGGGWSSKLGSLGAPSLPQLPQLGAKLGIKDTKEPETSTAEAQVTTDQLVKMALTSHQETTAIAKRAEN